MGIASSCRYRGGNHAVEITIPSPAQPAALGQGVRGRASKIEWRLQHQLFIQAKFWAHIFP
jgi:hypothetical protein